MKLKICTDCIHHEIVRLGLFGMQGKIGCNRHLMIDLTNGKEVYLDAAKERKGEGENDCGREGKFYRAAKEEDREPHEA